MRKVYAPKINYWYYVDVIKIIALLLVGLSVGLGNFAASVAIGLGGVSNSLRLRIVIIFGLFETGMPIIGLIIGQRVAHFLGGNANIIGGTLLGLSGLYLIVTSLFKTDKKDVNLATQGWAKLMFAGLSLSIDNLVVGFGLGTSHEPLLLALLIIGITSAGLSLVGLELGKKLNFKIGGYSELMSGLILMLVGLLISLKFL